MQRTMLKSKIHRATVTDCDLHYVGSITIDPDLLEAADILEHEQVHVVDVDNGARFETYTIAGERGSGDMCINGAAARLVHTGDRVIVVSYAEYDAEVATGRRDADAVLAAARRELDAHGVEPEYLELRSADDLSPAERVNGRTLLAVAARVGRARLIDNTILGDGNERGAL